jgi:high-affinity nickel permease
MVREIANNVVETLKSQPALLALIVTNIVLLVGFAYILQQISASSARKDNLIAELSRQCAIQRH